MRRLIVAATVAVIALGGYLVANSNSQAKQPVKSAGAVGLALTKLPPARSDGSVGVGLTKLAAPAN
jgi:hypothetical protein